MNNPPYLTSPGTIRKCFEQITKAPTPERVTLDFIQTKLGIKGGTGNTIIPFLKKIGFVNSDGTPSEIYKRFRNPTESKSAVASAIRHGYKMLYDHNEYFHELKEPELKGLIVQATGLAEDSFVVSFTLRTLKNLKEFASFEEQATLSKTLVPAPASTTLDAAGNSPDGPSLGMNLSYTINLNLPATADVAVFNAIFKSLKENLLSHR